MPGFEGEMRVEACAVLGGVVRVGHLIEDRIEAALLPAGLSLAKLGVLSVLLREDRPLPLGQLAERLACVKSNITQLVDRLEAEGLVRRVADPDDRRSVLAQVTAAGRERCEAGERARAEVEAELLSPLLPEDRERLAELAGRLEAGVAAG